jgi:hypothetical protein
VRDQLSILKPLRAGGDALFGSAAATAAAAGGGDRRKLGSHLAIEPSPFLRLAFI